MTNVRTAKVKVKSKCVDSTQRKKDGLPSEHQIQSCFFDWVRLSTKAHPELRLCIAIPNAAKRSPGLAAWLRREGLTAGVPDVLLLVPRGIWCGLAIEFKRPGGKISPAQSFMIDDMRGEGWKVAVMHSTEEAITIVKEYLG